MFYLFRVHGGSFLVLVGVFVFVCLFIFKDFIIFI